MKRVYLDHRLEKQMDLLRRSGKKAAIAVQKAEEIVTHMSYTQVIPNQVGTVTKHGELRIKGVMKYDLGSGYRLITYKHSNCFFLLYVGSHDDCHRWIENNRELTVEQIKERCTLLTTFRREKEICQNEDQNILEEEEFDPLVGVSEEDLRQVFCGLVARGH